VAVVWGSSPCIPFTNTLLSSYLHMFNVVLVVNTFFTFLKLIQMLGLYVSCAYDQFEHLLAHAYITTHIAQHHLEYFHILIAILLKLLYFPHLFALMHIPMGKFLLRVSCCFCASARCLLSVFINKGENYIHTNIIDDAFFGRP
jgi:low temperature requirement protein LtrA